MPQSELILCPSFDIETRPIVFFRKQKELEMLQIENGIIGEVSLENCEMVGEIEENDKINKYVIGQDNELYIELTKFLFP